VLCEQGNIYWKKKKLNTRRLKEMRKNAAYMRIREIEEIEKCEGWWS
jgi:hypothetical protein